MQVDETCILSVDERNTGIEPASQAWDNKSPDFLRADTRTRTGDLRITNALLYQLSHIGNLRINQLKKSTPAGARTLDTLIKSQVLYQLSYGCIISKRKEVSFLLLYTRRGSNPGHPD